MNNESYDPNGFVDWFRQQYGAKNDAQLALKMEISPVIFSRIRHQKHAVPKPMLVHIQEFTGLHIRLIRAQMVKEVAPCAN
ncbi:MAG TPA: hypothetical protein VN081_06845 [Dongiaceae bacterium]|nr:hypothetical protein [Dongiaceae bacterium]